MPPVFGRLEDDEVNCLDGSFDLMHPLDHKFESAILGVDTVAIEGGLHGELVRPAHRALRHVLVIWLGPLSGVLLGQRPMEDQIRVVILEGSD